MIRKCHGDKAYLLSSSAMKTFLPLPSLPSRSTHDAGFAVLSALEADVLLPRQLTNPAVQFQRKQCCRHLRGA